MPVTVATWYMTISPPRTAAGRGLGDEDRRRDDRHADRDAEEEAGDVEPDEALARGR